MSKIYYTAPTEQVFNDLKYACLMVWNSKGNDGGYKDEKITSVENIGNVSDNFMTLLGMFDIHNQREAISKCMDETKKEIKKRLIDDGNPDYIISAMGL